MICPYCLDDLSNYFGVPGVYQCDPCSVTFRPTYDNRMHQSVDHPWEWITFHLEKEQAFYHLELYPKDKVTKISLIRKYKGRKEAILTIPSLLGNVTPSNAMEKLNYLLIFS